MKHWLPSGVAFCALNLILIFSLAPGAGAAAGYVGSATCGSCHQGEYRVFQSASKKAHTRRQVEKLLPKLSGEEQTTCFSCHATGYGKPGGFVSYAQTPELGDIGCETCHGPGAAHVALQRRDADTEAEVAETGESSGAAVISPLLVRRPATEVCQDCHTLERGGVPPRYSGAH
ncbi:MAG: cytochrome c family protein [Deltaproteobacteria bacterium]|jgi:hypothetical protein|nr:cytochrome c family protein [Deltaproteobacteria bacterium]